LGGQPEGLLAALGFPSASASDADQLLDRPWLVPIGVRVSCLREHWRTAGCGPARPVVWEGRANPGPYPILHARSVLEPAGCRRSRVI
jgi:hypothetical protein